ncbi:hypothetical protein I5S86_10780 [Priestia aryabhattai]|nr:hypothetical protein I5S86_10780 [Priestia aryabhattai]
MPSENRSSNTELSKIVTEALVGMVSGVTGMKPPPGEPLPGFIQAPIDRAVTRISGLLAQPAHQPHPEPIAWMVGTAIWWTKAEAERDAAAVGLPVVGLGPMTGISPAEQHRGDPIMLTAVATLVDDGDGGLEASWLLEGGTAELFAGMTLLVAENSPELCQKDGSTEVYTHANQGK